MTDPDLKTLLEAADWAAVERARAQGEAALEVAAPLLRHEDMERRLLVIDVARAVGGRKAAELLVAALEDGNRQVRASAVNALLGLDAKALAGLEPRVMQTWERSACPTVRRSAPMIIGRIEGGKASYVRQRLADHDPVTDGLVVSLAKLGDLPARRRFARMLEAARGKRAKELGELLPYLDQPFVLPHLRPLLDRVETAEVLSTHAKDTIRRACDFAMDEVVRQASAVIGVERALVYEDGAIGKAKAHLGTLPRLALDADDDGRVDPR